MKQPINRHLQMRKKKVLRNEGLLFLYSRKAVIQTKPIHFSVDGQHMSVDSHDTDGIIRGSRNLFQAQFNCGKDWTGCKLAAEFSKSTGDPEYIGVDNLHCMVPKSVLDSDRYAVRLIGVRTDGYKITTNKVWIYQGE